MDCLKNIELYLLTTENFKYKISLIALLSSILQQYPKYRQRFVTFPENLREIQFPREHPLYIQYHERYQEELDILYKVLSESNTIN